MQPHITEVYARVFSALKDRKASHDEFTGFLSITPELEKDLVFLCDEGITSGSYDFTKDGKPRGSANLGTLIPANFQDCVFEVELSKTYIKPDSVVCASWSDLLKDETKVKKPVKHIFFTDSSILLSPGSTDAQYINYLKLSEAYKFIKELAESTEGGDKTIFYERPLSFEFTLTESDLTHPIDLDALEKLMKKDLHQEAIACLICKELVSFLKDIDIKQRFSYLIQHMSSLVSNVLLSYQSYVESYTFDKVRKEYLEKKTEYISDIHEVFNTMATKLLSLPAGIWFATTQINQMPTGGLESMPFAKNLTVLITVALLVILLVVSLIDQFEVLKVHKSEYSEVFDELKGSFEEEATKIQEAKDRIDSAYTKVCIKLGFAIFAALVLFGLTLFLFCKAYA
ncbi:hypothetical protein PRUB_a4058 [Pseudoalteromonas rubra]|uniref:Uncharacterized protein n=1 Tax=Pseudoalteromonas rubra TaxID=43658 RepID=A0A8T0CAT4_9GAMM|nr:hypothetical protein [Pseudoalteromonas rubra]KAF7787181.1 hypothetical protein PRUB_a4058 [Pseudoalteromonas rubra]